jgi:hypothetical protein
MAVYGHTFVPTNMPDTRILLRITWFLGSSNFNIVVRIQPFPNWIYSRKQVQEAQIHSSNYSQPVDQLLLSHIAEYRLRPVDLSAKVDPFVEMLCFY